MAQRGTANVADSPFDLTPFFVFGFGHFLARRYFRKRRYPQFLVATRSDLPGTGWILHGRVGDNTILLLGGSGHCCTKYILLL